MRRTCKAGNNELAKRLHRTIVVIMRGPVASTGKVTASNVWGVAALSSLIIVLTGCSASYPIPKGDGQVVGGIAACVGPRVLHRQGFVAGTVRVLRGTVSETPIEANGNTAVLPTDQVASHRVSKLQEYRFDLKPGQYVLVAYYAKSTIVSWAPIVIQKAKVTKQSIPSPCI